jgi:transposase
MKLHALGIDLGKTVFHLVGLDSTGRLVIRKRCSRRQLLAFTANLEPVAERTFWGGRCANKVMKCD